MFAHVQRREDGSTGERRKSLEEIHGCSEGGPAEGDAGMGGDADDPLWRPLKGAAGRRVCGHFRLHLFVCFSSFFVVWSHLGQAVVSLGGDFWTRVPQVYRLCPFFCHILFVFVYLGHFRSHFFSPVVSVWDCFVPHLGHLCSFVPF